MTLHNEDGTFSRSHNHRSMRMRGLSETKTTSSKIHSVGLNLPIGVTEIEIDIPGGVKRIFKKEPNKVSLSSVSPDDDYWLGEDESYGSTFDFILDTNGNIHGSLIDLKEA